MPSYCATPLASHHAPPPNVTSVFMQSPSTPSGGGTGYGNQVLSTYCSQPVFNAQQSAALGTVVFYANFITVMYCRQFGRQSSGQYCREYGGKFGHADGIVRESSNGHGYCSLIYANLFQTVLRFLDKACRTRMLVVC